MTVQPIGPSAIVLYLTAADFADIGPTAPGTAQGQLLALIRAAFSDAGIHVSGSIEIEIYPDRYGALVFARSQATYEVCFPFSDFNLLLPAARALQHLLADCTLVWQQGVYSLCVPGTNAHAIARLTEFSAPQRRTQARAGGRQAERILISGHILATLLHYFPEKTE